MKINKKDQIEVEIIADLCIIEIDIYQNNPEIVSLYPKSTKYLMIENCNNINEEVISGRAKPLTTINLNFKEYEYYSYGTYNILKSENDLFDWENLRFIIQI